jgi:type VI secretion system secreted protein VgrG
MTRRVTIQTPLGQALQFRQLRGQESISELYELDIDLLSSDKSIDPKALLGKTATVEVETDGGGKRYIDGIVSRFGMQGQDYSQYSYKLILRPWLWLATLRSDLRIFQGKTVPDIIEEVLGKYGYPLQKKLTRSYRAWEYCVQYHESDHNFIARLCEHEGIYYYYVHSAGQHTVVFADDVVSGHEPLPGGAAIPYYPPEKAAVADKECILSWQVMQEVHSGRHYNDDYDFEKPKADLSNMRQNPPGHAHDKYEQYEWPGGFTQFADGETYARVRLEQQLSPRHIAQASSNRRELSPGYKISLNNYPRDDQNQDYLILAVHYDFQENAQVSEGGSGQGSKQEFRLAVQPTSVPYRAQTTTPKPRTHGPQTAIVVGPKGEEIWVDKYGRVKVQFHWDRIGSLDENSSCWVRVSTAWAGSNFGAVFTPRIGMEVIIDFLNGDPDYPILTGCVYNANNMPPWQLPANATQSGWLTRSSKEGGYGNANALRFEDKKGSEQVWLHAEKNQDIEVENDETHWVGHDRSKTVDHDETVHVKHDRTETVDNNETITIGVNRTESVGNNETISVGANRSVSVGGSETKTVALQRTHAVGVNESIAIGAAQEVAIGAYQTVNVGANQAVNVGASQSTAVGENLSTTIGKKETRDVGDERQTSIAKDDKLQVGKKYILEAADEITLKTGEASITMKKDGTIQIKGKDITITGGGKIGIKASGDVVLKGSKIAQN